MVDFIIPDVELVSDVDAELETLASYGLTKTNLAINILHHRLEYGDGGLDSFMEDMGPFIGEIKLPDDTPEAELQRVSNEICDASVIIYEEVCTSLKPTITVIEANYDAIKWERASFIDTTYTSIHSPVVISIKPMDE